VQYINAVWALVGIYWIVEMVRAKPAVKRESILSSVLHVVVGCAAVALVWDRDMAIGFLGHRLTSASAWVQWLGFAATIGG
jgi:hypothetical protein